MALAMSSDNNNTLRRDQQALPTAGFLGGISFTALVLVLQAQAEFTPSAWGIWGTVYFGILVSIIGSASAFFIFASVVMTGVAAGELKGIVLLKRGDFAGLCFVYGFLGILCSVPLLLLPVSWVATAIVGALEASLFRVFQRLP